MDQLVAFTYGYCVLYPQLGSGLQRLLSLDYSRDKQLCQRSGHCSVVYHLPRLQPRCHSKEILGCILDFEALWDAGPEPIQRMDSFP